MLRVRDAERLPAEVPDLTVTALPALTVTLLDATNRLPCSPQEQLENRYVAPDRIVPTRRRWTPNQGSRSHGEPHPAGHTLGPRRRRRTPVGLTVLVVHAREGQHYHHHRDGDELAPKFVTRKPR